MANTKVTQHVIANNAITADQIASAAVTDAKLHATLDLSGKTLTLPATTIPSASTATTQSASDNSTKLATTAYVTTAIGNLVDSAPTALDTLNELAAALGDDANFSGTITTSLAGKLPLAGGTLTGALTLSGAPTNALHPATKTYTDTADALKLNLSGGTLTGDLILNTTTALQIPAGTTGQRPSAATGQIRWNTTDGALEVYNGTAWTAVGTGSSNKVLDTFTGNGSNATFILSVTPANEDAIMVFIDGAYQEKADYTLTNNSLVLDTAPLNNEKIAVHTTTAAVHDGTTAVNQQFTATANQTDFTLSQDPSSENNTQVYINGVYQQKTDYTVTGTTLAFDTGLTVGDVVEVNMFTVATLGNTDTVTEGVSNQYFTDARARGAISVSGNAISYNSSTGVLTANFEEGPTFTSNVNITGDLDVGAADSNNAVMKLSANTGNWVFTNVQSNRNLEISDSDGTGTVLTINTSGNVGIGDDNPSEKFVVKGDGARMIVSSADMEVAMLGRAGSSGAALDKGYLRLRNQGVTADGAVISAGGDSWLNAGNVGIGTTAPNQWAGYTDSAATLLQIQDTNQRARVVINGGNGAFLDLVDYAGATDDKILNLGMDAGVGGFGSMNDANSAWIQQNILKMDLGTGKVGIGTATPNAQLDIAASINANLRFSSTYNYGSNRDWQINTNNYGSSNWGGWSLEQSTGQQGTPSVARIGVHLNGNVGINMGGDASSGLTDINPATALHVGGDITVGSADSVGTGAASAIRFVNDNERSRITSNYASGGGGQMGFWTDSTGGTLLQRAYIQNDGEFNFNHDIKLHNHYWNSSDVMKAYSIGGPGGGSTLTRTINVNTYWGFAAQGGAFFYMIHGWQLDSAVGMVHWHNNGSSPQIITGVGINDLAKTGLSAITATKGSGNFDIDITLTGTHSNTHGWYWKVWA